MSRNIARYRHIRALSNAYPSPVEVQVHQPISEKKSNLRDSFLRGLCFGGVSALGLWTFKQFYGLEKAEAAQISDGGGISRRQRFNFVTEVVAETKASLVYIKIKDKQVRNFYTGEQQIVSNGSGFIVGQDGLILTNAHVVEGKPRTTIEVELQDGRTFVARVEDMDRNGDLATLRINCKNLPVMKLGTSADIEAGEFVIALGSPLALSNTTTFGVVSSTARDKRELGIRQRDVPSYIQTDATITFGNSGGPLINLDGEAIGVNAMKVTPGISFAIPIDYAKEFLNKSKQRKEGKRSRRFMGITMLTITPDVIHELRQKMNFPRDLNSGIIVYRVVVDSPSDNAGIRPGDIITHINGMQMRQTSQVFELLESNVDLELIVRRGDQTLKMTVKPE